MHFTLLKEKIKSGLMHLQKRLHLDMMYLAKNSFWVLLGNVPTLASGIILAMVFARFSTQEIYGNYQFVLSTLAIFNIISLPGINTAIVQAVARGKEGVYERGVRLSFYWSMIGVPLILCLAAYYFRAGSSVLAQSFIIASLFFPFFYAPNSWISYLQGTSRFSKLSLYQGIQALTGAAAIITTILVFRENTALLITVYLGVITLTNVLFYRFTRTMVENDETTPDWKSYGFFLTKLNVCAIVAANVDNIIVGALLGAPSVAIYAIGTKFTKAIQGVIKDLVNIIIPKIAQRNTFNVKKYLLLFFLSVLGSLVLYVLTPFAVVLLFSKSYTPSIIISQILILFLPFWVIQLVLENHIIFFVQDKKILFIQTVFVPVLYFILLFPLVFSYQVVGLALAQGLRAVISIVLILGALRFTKRNPAPTVAE